MMPFKKILWPTDLSEPSYKDRDDTERLYNRMISENF
jgi:hypothetical protein